MSLLTVTAGTACSRVGELAQTASGNIAACESGVWRARDLSNPEVVVSGGPVFSGFGGDAHFVACPAGKRAIAAGCGVWATAHAGSDTNFGFAHDESTLAGGVDGYGFPIPGDAGGYCLYVAQAGNSGAVLGWAICVDR